MIWIDVNLVRIRANLKKSKWHRTNLSKSGCFSWVNLNENEWIWDDLNCSESGVNGHEIERAWEHLSKSEWICASIRESQRIWMWSESASKQSSVNPSETAWIWLDPSETGWMWIGLSEAGEIRWVQTSLDDSERECASSSENTPSTQNHLNAASKWVSSHC